MPLVIDSHTHIFPNRLDAITPLQAKPVIEELRKRARTWLRPVTGSMHKAQGILRHLPDSMRILLDEVAGLAPLPSLIIESTVNDLIEGMNQSNVDYTMVIAHPPFITNEFILEACAIEPRLKPVVNIAKNAPRPAMHLRRLAEKGAVALKIHPPSDGEGPDSDRYRTLLRVAAELGLPVILHTGCIHTRLLYKDPLQGEAQRYAPWFKEFKNTRFVLAHMNFHEPHVALDLVEDHDNVFVETSWQPAEVIGEAVRRVGAERVLFGTDWPFVGDNLDVGLRRIRTCIDAGTMTEEQSELVLGKNAARVFNLES